MSLSQASDKTMGLETFHCQPCMNKGLAPQPGHPGGDRAGRAPWQAAAACHHPEVLKAAAFGELRSLGAFWADNLQWGRIK